MYEVYFLFGDSPEFWTADNVQLFSFDTEKELEAFLNGIDAAIGYLDCQQFDNEKDAREFIQSNNPSNMER